MAKVRRPSVQVNVATNGKARVNVIVNVHAHERQLLRFGHGNAKLDPAVFTFSLPAGHFCPFANQCRSKSNRLTGRIKDGPNTEFRCYAASSEARARSVRESRWHNAELLRSCRSADEMTSLILSSLSPYAGMVRIHVSGDFFTQDSLDAWLHVARVRPATRFYAYTKSLPFWLNRLDEIGTGHEPCNVENFILTASYGGTHDSIIKEYGLRFARVVFTTDEAHALGLPIDHDDSHAMRHGQDFALLLHGTQPPGSPAAKALSSLWQGGEYGYGNRADAIRLKLSRRPQTPMA